MSKSKILDKIRKLLALAACEGATEAEVQNALAQAENLRTKYQIDISELEISPNDIDYEYLLMDTKSFEPKKWIDILAGIIAFGYNCKLITVDINSKKYVRIVGFSEDVQIAENVIFTTKNIIREMADIQWKINGKTKNFRDSYIYGFLQGLHERLSQERQEKFSIEEESKKYELIVVKKDSLIQDFIYKNWSVTMNKKPKLTIKDKSAFVSGMEDGKRRNYNAKALKN